MGVPTAIATERLAHTLFFVNFYNPNETEKIVQNALYFACHNHPQFVTEGYFQAMTLLQEEVGEAATALNDGDKKKYLKDLGHVTAVVLRTMDMLLKELEV